MCSSDLGDVEIWLDNPLNVAGFQFMLSGLEITGVSGGSSADAGFSVSSGNNTILGFSFSGAVIPIGNSILLNVAFDGVTGDSICFSNAILSDTSGDAITTELGICLDPSDYFNGGCSDEDACNYVENTDYDDGSCTYVQENFDCDGNCTVNIDCNGECGGTAIYDACGDCGGDGSNCENPQATIGFGDLGGDVMLQIDYIAPESDEACLVDPILSDADGNAVSVLVGECISISDSGSLDLFLNSSIGIAGFQFDIIGVTINGVSGGSAAGAGFTISNSTNTVVGFSLTGSIIDPNGIIGCMDEAACNFDDGGTIPSEWSVECGVWSVE